MKIENYGEQQQSFLSLRVKFIIMAKTFLTAIFRFDNTCIDSSDIVLKVYPVLNGKKLSP